MKAFQTLVLALFCSLLVTGCGDSYAWHQKMTVTVDTPEGEKSGASVVRVTARKSKFVPGHPGGLASGGVRGEATVVEVAPGKFLFALLKGETSKGRAGQMAQYTFNVLKLRDTFEERSAYLSELRAKAPVPWKSYPLLVTFDDITDPASVKQVDPGDLAATFGPGTALKSITLEMTDGPVTTGKVASVLGWLAKYYSKRLDGQRYGNADASNRFANSLASGAFSTRNKK